MNTIAFELGHKAGDGIYLRISIEEDTKRWNKSYRFDDELDKMKAWLEERILYLDSQINAY